MKSQDIRRVEQPGKYEGQFQFNEFAMDWPLNGDEELLGDEIRQATLKKLAKEGPYFDELTLGPSCDVPPRALALSADAYKWFEDARYFSTDRSSYPYKVLFKKKWQELFIKIDR